MTHNIDSKHLRHMLLKIWSTTFSPPQNEIPYTFTYSFLPSENFWLPVRWSISILAPTFSFYIIWSLETPKIMNSKVRLALFPSHRWSPLSWLASIENMYHSQTRNYIKECERVSTNLLSLQEKQLNSHTLLIRGQQS